MPATTTVAIEMIEFAAELGERFPDKYDRTVLEDVSEAFAFEYDEVLSEDAALSRTILHAYETTDVETTDVEAAIRYAWQTWRVYL